MNIEGKRILITGGSSGIGLALAKALLAKGARVIITGRRADTLARAIQELKQTGSSVWSVAADVALPDGRAATIKQGIDALGGLDILVNNAGGVRAGRLENTSEAELQAMIEVDLVAPILLTRAAMPALRASGDAMIVNVASGIALMGAPFYATYAATKAGLARFGEALRRELKGEGIHVLTAYPSSTDTPMMKSNHAGPELGFSSRLALTSAKGQFLVGVLLGLVWSPCVGPTLGAASLLAAQRKDLGNVATVMLAFGVGTTLPILMVAFLTRQTLLRWRERVLNAGRLGKVAMGVSALAVGALILTGADRSVEAAMVSTSPAWLTNLTTRF